MRNVAAVMLFAGSLLVAAPLSADAGPRIPKGWVLTFGPTAGFSMHEQRSNGAVLGGEISAPYLMDSGFWIGAYADALHDFGPSRQRLSIGPEAGFAIFGVDGGFLTEIADGYVRKGYTMRGVLTLGVLGLYGRYGHLDGKDPEASFGEIGLLFKGFTTLSEQPQRGPRPRPVPPPATDNRSPDAE